MAARAGHTGRHEGAVCAVAPNDDEGRSGEPDEAMHEVRGGTTSVVEVAGEEVAGRTQRNLVDKEAVVEGKPDLAVGLGLGFFAILRNPHLRERPGVLLVAPGVGKEDQTEEHSVAPLVGTRCSLGGLGCMAFFPNRDDHQIFVLSFLMGSSTQTKQRTAVQLSTGNMKRQIL